MNNKVLKILEYYKIINQLLNYATTDMGKKRIKNLKPTADVDLLQEQLDETKDGVDIYRLKDGIPLPELESTAYSLKRLKIGGNLNGKELAAIGKALRSVNEINIFFDKFKAEGINFRRLYQIVKNFSLLPGINQKLNLCLRDDGYVLNDASSTLKSIRNQIVNTETQIREKMNSYTRGNKTKYLSNANVTIRDDRYVIPIKQEHRAKFGGIVHDQSSSGQTLFVEPAEIVELNNRLRQQQVAEKEEVQRILAELSDLIRPYTEELEDNEIRLGVLDFINAKAKYAHQIKATEPIISVENDVYLRQAWHPLLNEKTAVKNDIAIGKDYKAIVITGPNTGGKTITLKTLGLIQLMGQSGLFIPTFEDSRIGLFDEIFADIGDEQSIEQSLSTFSSHMTNIVSILDKITDHSLVLFDELGAGTDPQEGAALAISILDAVGAKGSYVVATTHYPELKAYGFERPQTINASMEFDINTLKPTYHLLLGIPGRSNAFDISKKLGLDDLIVEAARQLTDSDSQDLNEMISDLVAKRHDAEEKEIKFNKLVKEAQELHDDLKKNYLQFTKQKDNMISIAKKEANDIVESTKRESQELIADLRKMKLDGANNINEGDIINKQGQINALHQEDNLKKNKVLRKAKAKQELKPNDDVLVKTYGQRGVLIRKLSQTEWEVQLGILKMKVEQEDLEKVKVDEPKIKQSTTIVKSSSSSHVATTLDLRGERYEDAMNKVDHYIDAAILAGYPSVTIIHGKGTGALRNGIIKYLQSHRSIKRFGFASPNNGGNGATVVEFK
ncbi:muts2 protein [Ligilactobacillus hayakitensis DSM 18933 = JCM 14209]|uniref:Endonuclease MutS2 n=1 Tax=Ligilactobacillus hayakitensis DSM 18933 = JCM 14209 TaxID=1423755 RepID=A0A0R1WUG1_9LACO|nr:endonuclease MutS2 [Ligilactobacillus hayakitensis]KRM18758.1 muts2 protein [Ligilactobacillus hayakitensis DSM 18933 = JCM 14209]